MTRCPLHKCALLEADAWTTTADITSAASLRVADEAPAAVPHNIRLVPNETFNVSTTTRYCAECEQRARWLRQTLR